MNGLGHDSDAVIAHPSATIIVVRDAAKDSRAGAEVLMIRRSEALKFAPGAYVFPGGRVDTADVARGRRVAPDMDDAGHRIAAIRELQEETALCLPEAEAANLVPFAHWITPPESPKRFDTLFYLCRAPQNSQTQDICHDGTETTEARWITPRAVLEGEKEGRFPLMFPTRLNLMLLDAANNIEHMFNAARKRKLVPVMPAQEMRNGELWFTIPPEAGYPVNEVHRNHVFELMGQKADLDE